MLWVYGCLDLPDLLARPGRKSPNSGSWVFRKGLFRDVYVHGQCGLRRSRTALSNSHGPFVIEGVMEFERLQTEGDPRLHAERVWRLE